MAELMTLPTEDFLMGSNSESLRPRSFLSRFSNPLSTHGRNVFDLAIEPDDPFKIYSPGEVVKGHVVLTAAKGFEITHLVVALHGYAKVFRHSAASGDGLPVNDILTRGSPSTESQYYGNGLVSLFYIEQVLCGNGFLKKQVWKFAFELQFPNKSLPSTIDFERGTVSYMLTTTITRPITIAPTTTKYKRLKFQDHIDIESMYTSKMRFISLEPISRRGKVRKVLQAPSTSTNDMSIKTQLTRNSTHSSTRTSNAAPAPIVPSSPAPSDDTVASATPTSTHSCRAIEFDSPVRRTSPQRSETRSSTTSSSLHNITATTELLRQGALPGDTVPIRVTVTHNKPYVKGFVIATLYRQCRIDMHPALPRIGKGKEKMTDHEDVYPRSLTGLGGLYFSNGSSHSVFRMDLGQSSTMMIIDPQTLTADVTTSIKIPNSLFPTISNVPGGMISFTYHVEVVIDLFGKLAETRLLPRLTSSEPTFTHTATSGNQLTSEWSNNILDTSQLRRTKSVVTFELSLVVGTADSSRRQRQSQVAMQGDGNEQTEPYDQDWQNYHPGNYEYDEYYSNGPLDNADYEYEYGGYQDSNHDHYFDNSVYPPQIIPPPEVEEGVDEKTRLARQEALLLPSQPPEQGESSSGGAILAPSAPTIPLTAMTMRDGEPSYEDLTPSAPDFAVSVASARSADTLRPLTISPPPPPLTPDEGDPSDDKQELERQRLMAQASAPPIEEFAHSSNIASAPSAPPINDDSGYHEPVSSDEGSQLPRYQR